MATIAEHIAAIRTKLKDIQEANFMGSCAQSAHAEVGNRIFLEGKNSSGNAIGTYKGGELYVNFKTVDVKKQQPRGKPGANRNIKNRKTTYFESYAAFKAAIAGSVPSKANSPNVSLILNKLLSRDFLSGIERRGKVWSSGLKNKKNVPKFDNALLLYGVIVWRPNKKEIDIFKKCFAEKSAKKMAEA